MRIPDHVAGWNITIGPLVATAADLTDELIGGVISEFKVVVKELKLALVAIGEEKYSPSKTSSRCSTPCHL